MTEAFISGMATNSVVPMNQITIMNRSNSEQLQHLQQKYGVSLPITKKQSFQQADLIVLAIKPKDVITALQDCAAYLKPSTAVLSVVAGVSMATIAEVLGRRPIARTMPNTSAALGLSASAVAWNEDMTEETKTLILSILHAVGMVKEVEEDDLHAVTALFGSGPAYIYYLVEALEAAALEQGLAPSISREMILQTCEGAAAMLRETQKEPAQLRREITSAGGTTEAGIGALEQGGFKELMAECIRQAEHRSRELGGIHLKS